MWSLALLGLLTATPETLIDVEDPALDADGPGTYAPPSDAELKAGDFDLRRFVARVDRDDIVFEVTLGEQIRMPGSAWRTNATPVDLTNGIYVQNVDIYVDTDPNAAGESQCIPGRRVAFAQGRTWKRAVVLAPQRGGAAAAIEGAMGLAASQVTVPGPLTVRGKTIIARVPIAFFGAKPSRDWGWSVQVSGAAWERNFLVVDQLRGVSTADALTMPVSTTPERWAFGGAELGRFHPQVVDVLLPKGVEQKTVLSSFSNENGTFAQVPFVYSKAPPAVTSVVAPLDAGTAPSPSAAPRSDGWSVVDISGEVVSIQGPTAQLSPMMFGQVLDGSAAPIARVVVMQVLPTGIVATAVDHADKITRGARVSFSVKTKESP